MSEVLGKCPKCGADVTDGQYGAYCTGKCGMSLGYAIGQKLSDNQIKTLLEGKKLLLKGLVSKRTGNTYDAYIQPTGVEPYTYTNKNGEEKSGYQFKFDMSFPEKNDKKQSNTSNTAPGTDTTEFDPEEEEEDEFTTDDFSDDDECLPFN